jgi:hypothetical protein
MAEQRRCIGSAKFGIEAHEAPVEDFPKQPSQKDGLGRMCRTHWNQYTTALRKAALARKAADGGVAAEVVAELEPSAVSARKGVGGRRGKEARATKPKPIRAQTPRKVRSRPPGAATDVDATPTPAPAVDSGAQEDGVA